MAESREEHRGCVERVDAAVRNFGYTEKPVRTLSVLGLFWNYCSLQYFKFVNICSVDSQESRVMRERLSGVVYACT